MSKAKKPARPRVITLKTEAGTSVLVEASEKTLLEVLKITHQDGARIHRVKRARKAKPSPAPLPVAEVA